MVDGIIESKQYIMHQEDHGSCGRDFLNNAKMSYQTYLSLWLDISKVVNVALAAC